MSAGWWSRRCFTTPLCWPFIVLHVSLLKQIMSYVTWQEERYESTFSKMAAAVPSFAVGRSINLVTGFTKMASKKRRGMAKSFASKPRSLDSSISRLKTLAKCFLASRSACHDNTCRFRGTSMQMFSFAYIGNFWQFRSLGTYVSPTEWSDHLCGTVNYVLQQTAQIVSPRVGPVVVVVLASPLLSLLSNSPQNQTHSVLLDCCMTTPLRLWHGCHSWSACSLAHIIRTAVANRKGNLTNSALCFRFTVHSGQNTARKCCVYTFNFDNIILLLPDEIDFLSRQIETFKIILLQPDWKKISVL